MTVELSVRVHPRAARDEIVGEREGAIVARLTAAPVDGKANAALVKLVAKRLGIAPSRVRIVRGERSRDKRVAIDGLDAMLVRERLLG